MTKITTFLGRMTEYYCSHSSSAAVNNRLFFWAVFLLFIFLGTANHADIPQIERDSLIALYNETYGREWFNQANWLGEPGTECFWYGVVCDSAQTTVLELQLSNNNLFGD